MSGNDDKDNGGSVVRFPRVFMPGSLDAPAAGSGPRVDNAAGGEERVPAALPRLRGVADMGPPLALTMPGIPKPDQSDASGDEDASFAPPPVEDPDNPTGRETLQLAMALMTAMGVAAAQGMWHRARRRQALADEARATADRAQAKTAGAGRNGGGPPKGGGLLTSSRQEAGSRRRPHKSPTGGRDGDHPSGPSGRKRKKRHRDPHDDPHDRGHKRDGRRPPKAAKGGKTRPWAGPGKRERRKHRKDKGSRWPWLPASKRRPGGKNRKGDEPSKQPDAKSDSKNRPDDTAAGPKHPRRKATWKAPRKSRPGPGGDKALPPGRKRWTRTAPSTDKPGAGKPSKDGKGKSTTERSRKPRSRRTWKSTAAWLKRRRARRTSTASSEARATGSAGTRQARAGAGRESWARPTPPPPPPGFEGMRPPPGADRTVRVTVERVDGQSRPRQEQPVPALAGTPASGRLALPAGVAASTVATVAPSTPDQRGARFVSAPRTDTQYADADLTIYDVIDADSDMADEITEGVDEARATADGCERLLSKLEALHAEVVDLKVPGVLEGLVVLLMEKTLTVKAKAEAIAANLPAAAEAISTAGANAAARHRPLADVTRDMGHARPAEREYHDE